jgi:outer membrane protein TolC
VRPIAERLEKSAETAYAAGAITQREWLDMRRAVLDVRLALADARTAREKSLARLERLVGVDFESLAANEVNRG